MRQNMELTLTLKCQFESISRAKIRFDALGDHHSNTPVSSEISTLN